MNIKDALREAVALIDGVKVDGKNNMKRLVIAMERIESVINAIDNAQKEEEKHAEADDQQREND